jgi:hypothetical protein
MNNRRRFAVSAAIGLLIVAGGQSIPVRSATAETVQAITILPGILFASIFWPEGAHSGSGLGGWQIWLMFGAMYVISFAIWMAVAWMAQSGLQRWRNRRSQRR